MKKLAIAAGALALATAGAIALVSAQSGSRSARPTDPTREDIRTALGQVPSFFDAYPEEGLAAWWEELEALELAQDTALPVKVKELIGLAVAAQIPCEYCVYFHAEVAALNGATEREREEAVAMAATTRHWSTVLNGSEIPFEEFQGEVARILTHVREKRSQPGPLASITDAKSAHADIERTLGLVPSFLARFPDGAIAPAWKQLRSVQLNPSTALSGKDKELIALGVAAQIPCRYCVHFHTEVARLHGASAEEIEEAIAIAALTRFGSTVLNGNRVDRATFKKEIDAIVRRARK